MTHRWKSARSEVWFSKVLLEMEAEGVSLGLVLRLSRACDSSSSQKRKRRKAPLYQMMSLAITLRVDIGKSDGVMFLPLSLSSLCVLLPRALFSLCVFTASYTRGHQNFFFFGLAKKSDANIYINLPPSTPQISSHRIRNQRLQLAWRYRDADHTRCHPAEPWALCRISLIQFHTQRSNKKSRWEGQRDASSSPTVPSKACCARAGRWRAGGGDWLACWKREGQGPARGQRTRQEHRQRDAPQGLWQPPACKRLVGPGLPLLSKGCSLWAGWETEGTRSGTERRVLGEGG